MGTAENRENLLGGEGNKRRINCGGGFLPASCRIMRNSLIIEIERETKFVKCRRLSSVFIFTTKEICWRKILFLLQISSTMSTNFAVLTFFVLLIKSWNTIYENWKCQVRKFVKLKYCFYTESNPSQRDGVQLIAKVHSHGG